MAPAIEGRAQPLAALTRFVEDFRPS